MIGFLVGIGIILLGALKEQAFSKVRIVATQQEEKRNETFVILCFVIGALFIIFALYVNRPCV